MVGELITLPLRVGVRATRLWLRATEEAVAVVADATGRLIDHAVPRGATASEPPRFEARPTGPGAETELAPDLFERGREAPPSEVETEPQGEREIEVDAYEIETFDDSAEPEPAHVSEEPVLVEEVADPGAEDGAGATVHVAEPWEGYGHMKADDVIARLTGATPAELAAIQLYETEGKGRVTVLEAVERELRISSGSGSQS